MFKQWFGKGSPAELDKTDLLDNHPVRTLDCLNPEEFGEIDQVPGETMLEALGFRPGKRVCMRCRTRFGGPLVAEIEGRHTALSRSVARQIRLRKHSGECIGHE
ncbi:FeoA family protein [Desulfonatronovibrio magnus]|uniref:FeoA family protein n=1 Tax=Desulfonatronovibrio magnus TaxID=698827 RepID=UPI0005EAD4D8|nr:FeoA family protein [Desulfonatronovibrio magnus]